MLREMLTAATQAVAAPPGFFRDSMALPLILEQSRGWSGDIPQPTSYKDYVELQETHAVVEKCVRLNATAVAQGRLRLYRRNDEGEEDVVEEHPIVDLFERVNDQMTSFDLFWYTVASKDLAGNAYWELVRKAPKRGEKAWLCGVEVDIILTADERQDEALTRAYEGAGIGALLERGPLNVGHVDDVIVRLPRGGLVRAPAIMLRTPVTEIWPLNPARITIEPNAMGANSYRYEINGKRLLFAPEQIIHFRNPAVGNDFYGLSPLRANVNTLVSDGLQEKANTALLRNAARPSGIMTYEKEATNDQIEAAVAMFTSVYGGSENAGKVLHVAGGREFKPLAITSADLQSFDRARWNKAMIQQALDVQPIVYGLDPGDTSATRENSETQVDLYVTFGVSPRAESIERTINERLLERLGMGNTEALYVRFDFSASPLYRKLLMRDAERIKDFAPMGLVLPGEVRSMLAGQRPTFGPLPWDRKWFAAGFTTEIADADDDMDEVPEMRPVGEAPALLPETTTPAEDSSLRTQDDALNGAQITAASAIVQAVADGLLPRDSAIGQLMVFFNLSREEAELILGSVGQGFEQPESAETETVSAPQEVSTAKAAAIRRLRATLILAPRGLPSVRDATAALLFRKPLPVAREPHTRASKFDDILGAVDLPDDDPELKRMQALFAEILQTEGEAALAELDIQIEFHAEQPEILEWLKNKTIEFARETSDTTKERLRESLLEGQADGETYQELAVRVREEFQGRKDNALTVARTECLPGSTIVDGAVVEAVHRRWYEGPMVEVVTAGGRKLSATPNHPVLSRRGWVGAGELKVGDDLVCDNRQQRPSPPGDEDVNARPATLSEIFDSAKAVSVLERKRTAKPDFHGDGMDGEVDILRPDRALRIGTFSALYKPVLENILSPADGPRAAFCAHCAQLLSIQEQACRCRGARLYASTPKASQDEPLIYPETGSDGGGAFTGTVSSYDGVDVDVVSKIVGGVPWSGGDAESPGLAATSVDSTGHRPLVDGSQVRTHGDANLLDGGPVSVELTRLGAVGVGPSSRMGEFGLLGLGPEDASLTEKSGQEHRVDMNGFSQGADGRSGQILLDDIVSVELRSFSGHVFNLSTPYGYYTANNGLVTGNTAGSVGYARVAAYQEAEIDKQEWVSSRDEHVRDSHEEMDGETVFVGEPFSNSLLFPGDTAHGQPEDWVNCRCSNDPIIPGAEERMMSTRDTRWRALDKRIEVKAKTVARQFIRILDKQMRRVLVALRKAA